MVGTQQLRDYYKVEYDAYENPDSFIDNLVNAESGLKCVIY